MANSGGGGGGGGGGEGGDESLGLTCTTTAYSSYHRSSSGRSQALSQVREPRPLFTLKLEFLEDC